MGSAVIFAGSAVKTLKNQISLNGGNDIITSTTDPTSSAVSANIGSLLLNSSNGKLYRKNDSGSSTNWTEVGSGTQSGINYITNPNASTNTTGWSTYKETDSVTFQDTGDTVTLNSHGISAGAIVAFTSITSTTGISTNTNYYVVNPTTNTFQVASSIGGSALALTTNGSGTMVRAVPKTGTGGTPNVTWTRSTTTPLRGAADFNFSKGAANYMGEGVATDFTIDLADLAKAITISFDYENLSGTYTTGDLTVYIIADPSGTPVIIQPAGYQVQAATAGTKMRFVGTFQTQATGQSYRMVVHTTTPSTSAYDFAFDNFSVGPIPGAITANVVAAYVTGTSTSIGTNTTITPTTIVKDTNGGWSGSTYTIPVSGYYSISGTIQAGSNTATYYELSYKQNSLASVLLGGNRVPSGTANLYASGTNIVYCNAGDTIIFIGNNQGTAQAPIAFTASINRLSGASGGTDSNVVACVLSGTTTSITSSGVTITPTTIVNDTNGAFSGSTYTVPVSGYYQIEAYLEGANIAQVSGNGFQVGYKKNAGAAVVFGGQVLTASVTTILAASGSKVALFNAGDTITFYAIASTTQTPGKFEAGIFRLSGPAVVTATDTVALSYQNTAGTSLTNGVTKIPFATSYFDTHAAWNGTTFTAPISGTYSFEIQLYFASATFTGTLKSIVLYIDGSAYRYLAMTFVLSSYTNTFAQNGTATIKLNAGQQVHFTANHNEGTAKSLDTTGGTNFLSIVRVGN